MNVALEKRIEDRARVVIGAHSWDREKSEPAVSGALIKALRFCEKFEPVLGSPSISGGTTSNPERVILLYWEIAKGDKLGGVYISFAMDGSAEIEWTDGNSAGKVENCTFEEVMNFDYSSKLDLIGKIIALSNENAD